MEQDRIWELFAQQLGGELTAADKNELHELQERYPQTRETISLLARFWEREIKGSPSAEASFMHHLQRMKQPSPRITSLEAFLKKETPYKKSQLFSFSLLTNLVRQWFGTRFSLR
ncbi:MAG TPA: hypothetical protein VHK91_15265 [Flavisolibacter sp.]|jgi:hypothetical protein|nr:hypothetical protein [Flavisolibacter sp.]